MRFMKVCVSVLGVAFVLRPGIAFRVKEGGSEKCGESDAECMTHCMKEYRKGDCSEGVCRCRAIMRHPTVRCEELTELNDKKTVEKLCAGHCRALGEEYVHGECSEDVCFCETGPTRRKMKSHPTVRCVVLKNGTSDAENHSACTFHCRNIGNQYVDGRCNEGVCTCRIGAIVEPVNIK